MIKFFCLLDTRYICVSLYEASVCYCSKVSLTNTCSDCNITFLLRSACSLFLTMLQEYKKLKAEVARLTQKLKENGIDDGKFRRTLHKYVIVFKL